MSLSLLDWSDWSDTSGLFSSRSSLRLCWRRLLRFPLGNLWIEGSTLKTIGSLRDVVPLQDPESVLTGGVSHSDGLPVLIDIAVLTNPLVVSATFLSNRSSPSFVINQATSKIDNDDD